MEQKVNTTNPRVKFTWMSNAPWASTGYGNQTSLFVPRLRDAGFDPSILCFYGLEGGLIDWNGIRCYPKGLHNYGVDIAGADAAHFGSKFIISLIDAWVIEPNAFPNIRWVPWFPVDMEPLPPAVGRMVSRAYKRIVFSRFGEQMVNNAGMDCFYVPHGVDTKVFAPIDRIEARNRLKFPKDRFLVGMVAANQGMPSRKAFTQQLSAFAEFKKKFPDAWLYIHTIKGASPLGQARQAQNLLEYCAFLGLKVGTFGVDDPNNCDVMFPEEYNYFLGFPPNFLVDLYNAIDLFMLVSMGEGFGIPILEAQACGCPVLVGDWTATAELCLSGYKVAKEDSHPIWMPLGSYQFSPETPAIVEQLKNAYLAGNKMLMRQKARAKAMDYDADLVVKDYWLPVLNSIVKEIDNPEIAPAMQLLKFE